MQELIGSMFLDLAALLGKRTAELHAALGSLTDDERFAPEPFSLLYQKSLYQSVYSLVRRTSRQLEKNMPGAPEAARSEIEKIRGAEETMVGLMQKILQKKISAMKIRIHGDYHLGQVLYTGRDFVIIDFEGEPARTLSERKVKQSPLKDVAGMLRSFHYAVYAALFLNKSIRPEDMALFEKWIEPWYRYVSGMFLRAYRETAAGASFVPADRAELELLLEFFLLEKAVYELGYELNNRPDWLIIPIKGIQGIFSNLV
jgi:maltose alpha-D-glucosyltransferase/alpha-amylase